MLPSYTKHQWTLLVIFCISYFCSGIGQSLQGPFYPLEAEEKGIEASQCGFIFSVYYMVTFIVSPICGKLLTVVDPTIIAKLGIFVIAITTILFGFLDKLYNATIFLAFSYALRIMEGFGFATLLTAGFSIIAAEFFKDIGTVSALLETSLGAGLIIGPAIGGFLYELQGFFLPFFAVGVLILCSSMISLFFLHSSDRYLKLVPSSSSLSICSLIKTPEIMFSLWAVSAACLNFGFFNATLEPHLRSLNISPSETSLGFTIIGLSYSVTSIIWGRVCDKLVPPQIVWSIGSIFVCISMILMGPAPYLMIPLNVPLCCVALALMGIGQAAELISSFYCLTKVALKVGLPDDIGTYGLVASLFNSAFSLGDIVGPTIGGFMLDSIGLPWGFHVVLGFHFLLLVTTGMYCFIVKENNFPNPRIKNIKDLNDYDCDKIPLNDFKNIRSKGN